MFYKMTEGFVPSDIGEYLFKVDSRLNEVNLQVAGIVLSKKSYSRFLHWYRDVNLSSYSFRKIENNIYVLYGKEYKVYISNEIEDDEIRFVV